MCHLPLSVTFSESAPYINDVTNSWIVYTCILWQEKRTVWWHAVLLVVRNDQGPNFNATFMGNFHFFLWKSNQKVDFSKTFCPFKHQSFLRNWNSTLSSVKGFYLHKYKILKAENKDSMPDVVCLNFAFNKQKWFAFPQSCCDIYLSCTILTFPGKGENG